MFKKKLTFKFTDVTHEVELITDTDEIEQVSRTIGADFVIRAINKALRDRAFWNIRAGVPVDSWFEKGKEKE